MSFKPIEPKRDEFRKYLERSGAIEALTKLFVKLFHETERPENPMEFIRENFGDSILHQQVIKDLKVELNDLKAENKALKDILQKNGLEAPENEATEESMFSQTAVSAVEMQEAINKENLKRNSHKVAESADQSQDEVITSSDPVAEAPAVANENNISVNKESNEEAPAAQPEPEQVKEISVPETNAQQEQVSVAKDATSTENPVAEQKPNEETAAPASS